MKFIDYEVLYGLDLILKKYEFRWFKNADFRRDIAPNLQQLVGRRESDMNRVRQTCGLAQYGAGWNMDEKFKANQFINRLWGRGYIEYVTTNPEGIKGYGYTYRLKRDAMVIIEDQLSGLEGGYPKPKLPKPLIQQEGEFTVYTTSTLPRQHKTASWDTTCIACKDYLSCITEPQTRFLQSIRFNLGQAEHVSQFQVHCPIVLLLIVIDYTLFYAKGGEHRNEKHPIPVGTTSLNLVTTFLKQNGTKFIQDLIALKVFTPVTKEDLVLANIEVELSRSRYEKADNLDAFSWYIPYELQKKYDTYLWLERVILNAGIDAFGDPKLVAEIFLKVRKAIAEPILEFLKDKPYKNAQADIRKGDHSRITLFDLDIIKRRAKGGTETNWIITNEGRVKCVN